MVGRVRGSAIYKVRWGVMSNEIARTEVDERTRRQVLALFGRKSPREIAESLGVTPDVVIRVKQDIMDSHDALTVAEHVAHSLALLRDVAENAREEFERTDDARSKAPLLAAAVTATKTFLNELKKWNDMESGKVETLNGLRQRELVLALNKMSDITANKLDDGQPHTKDEILQTMLDGLMEAVVEMETRNTGDM